MLSWRAATGWPSTSARISTPAPYSASHGARMKTARIGPPSMPGDVEVVLEGADLAAERVALAERVHQPRCSRSSMIIPAHVPSTGLPAGDERAQRFARGPRARCRASSSSTRRRASRARRALRGPPGTRTSRTSAPRPRSILRVRLEVALEREDADRSATSPGWRAADPLRACASRASASPCRGPPRRARRAPGP